MVILNKIYTKTGDEGSTALGSGERRMKHDARVCAYGAVDEANATIGVARLNVRDSEIDEVLALVQNDLFDLGADLAVPNEENSGASERLRIIEKQVLALEKHIDNFNSRLETLRSFVISGGSALSAHLHLARTVARRAERDIVELSMIEGEAVNPFVIQYINRLSDLLFVLARVANNNGKADILWVPGKNRN
ncbi:MAG: cob(I)yrinic acid a,c-diamide adenosyltransferase [Rhizobiaceae bacterium]|nr:cob(I)yrinic acid a,c-diamide adenosyltransferase [Rhizobiaceae bacterium]